VSDVFPIEVRNLVKRYGQFTAVDGIDFDVASGECVALLGPNGAGKTTTIRMLTCFSPITSGVIRVFGEDTAKNPRSVKASMGICPQEDNLDPDFSVRKNLLIFARYYDLGRAKTAWRADELLAQMGLTEKADSDIPKLSGGMKRRLMLARALINNPQMLVLDEPTTGLDPQARQLIWQRVRRLRRDGVTVLLTTHYMEEASQLADRVMVMNKGKILLEGAPDNLISNEVGREVVELWNVSDAVRAFLNDRDWPMEEVEDRLYISDREGGHVAQEIEARFPDQDRQIRRATLEDVFLRRTGRALKD